MSRRCRGVRCAEGLSCLGGRCVSEECLSGLEAACPEPECLSPADCDAMAECAEGACAGSVCLDTPVPGACEEGLVCDLRGWLRRRSRRGAERPPARSSERPLHREPSPTCPRRRPSSAAASFSMAPLGGGGGIPAAGRPELPVGGPLSLRLSLARARRADPGDRAHARDGASGRGRRAAGRRLSLASARLRA